MTHLKTLRFSRYYSIDLGQKRHMAFIVNDILVSSVMMRESESVEGLGVEITASNENA